MDREELLSTLKKLDEEVFAEFQDEIEEQRFTMSLIPTVNAESPFAAYLEGSILANVSTDYHGISRTGRFERMAVERALKCFHAEHAIVRLDSISAASRVVFKALLKSGNPVLSFNGRKQELCHGLSYRFSIFGADWENRDIDWKELDEQIARHQPKIVIFSPTSFPFAIDTKRLAKVTHEAGALLWIDIGQNVGLVAAGLMPSPVADADVVTFPTNDSLQGPEGAIILCKKELAETIERSVIDNGHSALHKNRLAALAVSLREASEPSFRLYGQQVIANARALSKALQENGIPIWGDGTDCHLVVAALPPDADPQKTEQKLHRAGFMIKTARLPAAERRPAPPVLRLSSLNPTTRSLKEKDMEKIGQLLAAALNVDDPAALEVIRKKVSSLLMDKPIYSEEWVESIANPDIFFNGADEISVRNIASNEKKHLFGRLFH
ncbi:serine hydroxymethyltransferase [uncultured Mitsuokella sp.]|uniref:serine hydroxymethyltransferase n=1 Tax=uncultured Mitsuokella sp. TaxID=453120 RepID=UPI0025856BF8|nr:serine hydroxymethyltransferase [uncultured Mitsuokella sp.]